MHPKMQTFSMQLADSLWLDHLALIDLMITMLTELSALASGITDSGGEAEPLILLGHTISVFLWRPTCLITCLDCLQTSSFHKMQLTCPVAFGSSRMKNPIANRLYRRSDTACADGEALFLYLRVTAAVFWKTIWWISRWGEDLLKKTNKQFGELRQWSDCIVKLSTCLSTSRIRWSDRMLWVWPPAAV